jgi:hypothetical protein
VSGFEGVIEGCYWGEGRRSCTEKGMVRMQLELENKEPFFLKAYSFPTKFFVFNGTHFLNNFVQKIFTIKLCSNLEPFSRRFLKL